MKLHTVVCRLGPTSTTLVTNHEAVLAYLSNFYTLTDGADSEWLVEAIVGHADDTMTTNPRGSATTPTPSNDHLIVYPQAPAGTGRLAAQLSKS